MRTYDKFQEYSWLVNLLCRNGKMSLETINERWTKTLMSDGLPMNRMRFSRRVAAVREMFGINIKCEYSNGYRYYIENEDVLSKNTIQNWLLSTLSVSNVISESKSISNRILLEKVPSEGDFLSTVIQAMKDNLAIEVDYQSYYRDHPVTMKVFPYFVKLFNKRWYLFAKNVKYDDFIPLSFDRMKDIRLTEETFEFPEDLDPETYMSDYYGVVINDGLERMRIVIRAFGQEANYMRDLPLHQSQREIDTKPEYSDFELTLKFTMDFFTALLSRGNNIKVLEPAIVAEELMYQHDDAVRLYTDEFELLEPGD